MAILLLRAYPTNYAEKNLQRCLGFLINQKNLTQRLQVIP